MAQTEPAAPRVFRLSDVEGQERALSLVGKALATDTIPSAWLFAGPRGVGKFTSAMATAAAINCRHGEMNGGGSGAIADGGLFGGGPATATAPVRSDSPRTEACGACASCRKVASGNHPDVRVVRVPPEKRVIPIEAVRDILAELAFRPYEGRRRVVVVDGAGTLTPQASNALLKTLEEPPPKSTWILVAESPSGLLPTVVSRCRIVRFGALDAVTAARILAREGGMDPTEARAVAALLGGSVGRALGEEAAWYRRDTRAMILDEVLQAVTHGGGRILDVADGWDKREKQEDLPLAAALEHVSFWVRDMAVLQASDDPSRLLHSDLLDRVKPLAQAPAPAIARAFDAVRLCLRDLKGNVNDKLAIETLLLALRRELAGQH